MKDEAFREQPQIRNWPGSLAGRSLSAIRTRRTGRTIKEVVAGRKRQRIKLRLPPGRWTAREN